MEGHEGRQEMRGHAMSHFQAGCVSTFAWVRWWWWRPPASALQWPPSFLGVLLLLMPSQLTSGQPHRLLLSPVLPVHLET